METGLNAFKEALHLKHVEAGVFPLALAHIGDAVYELAIRTPCHEPRQYAGQQDAQRRRRTWSRRTHRHVCICFWRKS